MAQNWSIDGPRLLDIGGDGETVTGLDVTLIAGHVDVVTHDDSPTARLEVTEVTGQPLEVSWDGSQLRISHSPIPGGLSSIGNLSELFGSGSASFLAGLKEKFAGLDRNSARLSVSVPVGARVDVKTVSATALVSGVSASVAVKTVSGSLTVDDIVGPTAITTVSGDVEASRLDGVAAIKSVSGAVTVSSSALPSADVKTVSGDITLDLTNAASAISATSVSGDLTVRAPYAGFDVTASSVSGAVVAGGRRLGGGSRPAAKGHLREGDGGLKITAKTVSGAVTLLHCGPGASTGDGVAAVAPTGGTW
ncbi:MAG: DUF4097 family beta strand repeat-containing protein [Nostocoides sp.]